MLPKKLHIQEIENFHNRVNEVSKELDKHKDNEDKKDYVYKLSREYYKLCKIWSKIDDFVEYEIKFELDLLKNESK